MLSPWLKVSLFLCVFGFVKELRPSEPFIYDYLISPKWHNVTEEEVIKEVYPVGTYSYLALLVLVFLVTDFIRYKPIIVLSGVSAIVIWTMLIWCKSLIALQIMEIIYGLFTATEIAYYTYIYAKVDKEHYSKVSSHTRAAILAGRSISGISSQLLISTNAMNFLQLNYISLASVSCATVWALLLPPVTESIYFHSSNMKNPFATMYAHMKNAFSNPTILKWSVSYALATCGFTQVENYMQPLYTVVQESDKAAYNGAVEAILALVGFGAALCAGYLRIDWQRHGYVVLIVIPALQCAIVGVASQTTEIYVCYTLYVTFGVLYYFGVTVASAEVSKGIEEDSYGLVFGANMFASLVGNSVLTLAVATKNTGWSLDPRDQYIVYAGWHGLMALLYLAMAIVNCILAKKIVI